MCVAIVQRKSDATFKNIGQGSRLLSASVQVQGQIDSTFQAHPYFSHKDVWQLLD